MNNKIKKPTSHNWLFHQITCKSIIKQAIVKMALFGLIPFGLATWFIKVARLSHE
jgi:hypothetical protein